MSGSGLGGLHKGPNAIVIGLCQSKLFSVSTPDDLAHALQHVLKLIAKARNGYPKMDMIVFPEYMLHGLSMSIDEHIMCTLDRPEVKALQEKCKECKIRGCFSIMEKNSLLPSAPWNTGIVINDTGKLMNYTERCTPGSQSSLGTQGTAESQPLLGLEG